MERNADAAAPLGQAFAGRRVVVTGGLGFIGSNLARRLVGAGSRVTLVDSLVPRHGGNRYNIRGIEDRVAVNISDVRDPHSLPELLRGAEFLFNLAGQTCHLDSMEDPFTDLETNCRAQLSILEACRRTCPEVKIVFASTRQIYGRPRYLPVDEAHPLRPVDVNGIHKLAAEEYHRLYREVYGLRTCSLRLTNTIGPRMRVRDARQTFLGLWIRRALEGGRFEVWGGAQLRDFTYVDDAVEALLLAAASDAAEGEAVNLGGTAPVSLREVAERVVALAGSGEFVVREFPVERRRIDIGDFHADWRKAAALLGWRPRTGVEEALRKTIAYYREHLPYYV